MHTHYLALARKWRPQRFTDFVGQEHVVRALTHALDSGRLHHAFLFTGIRGVGKTTVARLLAKALNCELGVSSTPCGACGACLEVEQGRFIDLIEVDAASRTKVDDTRELLENVQYAPSVGRYKVYLIDEVHMLSGHSFNALLKTLEEPPAHIKFLLATTDPQKLPVTVLSRCLQFNLKRIDASEIRERLAYILTQENLASEGAALSALATAADGSLRDALSLLDQAIVHGGGQVSLASVSDMLGQSHVGMALDLLEALARQDANALFAALTQAINLGQDPADFLDAIIRALHNAALRQVLGGTALEQIESTRLDALATAISAADLQIYYQIALLARRDLHLAPDPRLGLEMALLRMLAFYPDQGNNKPAQAAPLPVKPVIQTAPTLPSAASSAKDWPQVLASLSISPMFKAVLEHAVATELHAKSVIIALPSRHKSVVEGGKLRADLERGLSQYFGEKPQLTLSWLTDQHAATPARLQADHRQQRQQAAEQAVQADPTVQAILETFGGDIVNIQPR